jgi:glycosyltransferase involved in cell wall biosynthesis
MPDPRVTVIIPTYNWATVLPFSIGSVLDQTYRDFELMVIGDGCTDASAEVVRACGTGDPRVSWHNLAANGRCQAGPNNEGLRRARGEIIAYLGHDDLWLPHHLACLVAAVDQGAVVARTKVVQINPEAPPFAVPPVGWQYHDGEWIPPTCVGHRRDAALATGGWRFPSDTGNLDPESDLWSRLARRYGAPVLVPHLTAVKFPAGFRRDVYRTRPNREQAAWLQRIRAADDAGALAAAATDGNEPRVRPEPGVADEMGDAAQLSAVERQRAARRVKGLA